MSEPMVSTTIPSYAAEAVMLMKPIISSIILSLHHVHNAFSDTNLSNTETVHPTRSHILAPG